MGIDNGVVWVSQKMLEGGDEIDEKMMMMMMNRTACRDVI